MTITPQEALQRTIEHRQIFHDEMLHLMRLIMRGDMSPVMAAAIITGLRVKKETIGETAAAATVMREFARRHPKIATRLGIADGQADDMHVERLIQSFALVGAQIGAALDDASRRHFGANCAYMGLGGTIPLMNVLQEGFPCAQFMVCGVLGPKSNAHGPNEFLHVPYAKKLTAAVADVIAAAH